MMRALSIVLVFLALPAAASTLQRVTPTTSNFSRQALTNETAAQWRAMLGIGAGGSGLEDVITASNALHVELTGKVARAGDVMSGGLTNHAGYYGNGIGITNLQATNIVGAITDDLLSTNVTKLGQTIDLGSSEVTGTLAEARMPALAGDVTTLVGSVITTIAADAVNNQKMANMAEGRIKGRVSSGTGDPEDLTAWQVKGMLAITGDDVSGGTLGVDSAVVSSNLIVGRNLDVTNGNVTVSGNVFATNVIASAGRFGSLRLTNGAEGTDVILTNSAPGTLTVGTNLVVGGLTNHGFTRLEMGVFVVGDWPSRIEGDLWIEGNDPVLYVDKLAPVFGGSAALLLNERQALDLLGNYTIDWHNTELSKQPVGVTLNWGQRRGYGAWTFDEAYAGNLLSCQEVPPDGHFITVQNATNIVGTLDGGALTNLHHTEAVVGPTGNATNYTVSLLGRDEQTIFSADTNANITFSGITLGRSVQLWVDAMTSSVPCIVTFPSGVVTNSQMVLTVTNGTARIYDIRPKYGTDATNVWITAGDVYQR